MQLTISTTLAPKLITEGQIAYNPHHVFFCLSCDAHRDNFKAKECLRLYQPGIIQPTLVGFYCPNCFTLTTQTPLPEVTAVEPSVRDCVECGLLPPVKGSELCGQCIADFESYKNDHAEFTLALV